MFDAWGFDHCLWGTDWTRAFAVVNYEQAAFLETDRLSDTERAMLMGGACAKAYGWSPKKPSSPATARRASAAPGAAVRLIRVSISADRKTNVRSGSCWRDGAGDKVDRGVCSTTLLCLADGGTRLIGTAGAAVVNV